MRHTAQMSHTAHITRLYKCCAQSVWLNKHSAKKKEELYVLKGQHRWWPPSSAMSMWFFLIKQQVHSHWHHCCSHHLRWQWECHCCVWNSKQHGHATWSYRNTHQNVLMYNDISKKVSYCVSDSLYNRQKSTHLDSELELRWCMTADGSSPDSAEYEALQMRHSHWAAWECPLSEKSECTEWPAADQQRELNLHQQLQEWKWQHMCCKEWGPCELSASRYILI